MALISLLQITFGNLFVIRTLLIFRERGLIRDDVVTKTGTVFMTAICWLPFVTFPSRFLALFLTLPLALGPLLVFLYVERHAIHDLRRRFPLFLDRWLLNMRIGNSVISARDKALREECPRFQILFRPLFETRGRVVDHHLLIARGVRMEIENICASTHQAGARLENLRQLLRQTSEFRHRSGQAMLQTLIQAVVLLVLLFALAIYSVHRYGWTRCGDLVIASSLLSLIGVALMLHLARKKTWKI